MKEERISRSSLKDPEIVLSAQVVFFMVTKENDATVNDAAEILFS